MVARDDSVIRGSLIASLIFLVLSLALNFFLWSWGDKSAATAAAAKDQMTASTAEVRSLSGQNQLMKAMLGAGSMSQAEFEQLSKTQTDDPEMEVIEKQFVKDMSFFGPDVDPQNRNYHALPEFLVNAIRDRNLQYASSLKNLQQVREQTTSDVEVAQKAVAIAEKDRDEAAKKLEDEQAKFAEDRATMKKTTESIKESLNSAINSFRVEQKKAAAELASVKDQSSTLESTIETQRQELNLVRGQSFETEQGTVEYVLRSGKTVMIDLGAADQLRRGVTFGIVDGNETRLKDAEIKASIQVTAIRGPHLAECRVIAEPNLTNPIIPGDKIYSPFWAPGRKVKVALAGDIDIDGDGVPDLEQVRAQVTRVGAEVAATVIDGQVEGTFDSSVRFLVIGEQPVADSERGQAALKAYGDLKNLATQYGVTVIPAWKLQAFLRTLDDSITTPLGSGMRSEDFAPEHATTGKNRLPSQLPEMYLEQERVRQRDLDAIPAP